MTVETNSSIVRLELQQTHGMDNPHEALVTGDGVENLSAFVPSSVEDVERTIKEKGRFEFRAAVELPLKKNRI
jgi:hypothetical protein